MRSVVGARPLIGGFAMLAASMPALVTSACNGGAGASANVDAATLDASPDSRVRPDAGLDGATRADADAATDAAAGTTDGDADAGYDAADQPVVCAVSPCATALVAGLWHFCARMSDGTVQCWGANNRGELGQDLPDGSSNVYFAPARIAALSNVTQISAQGESSCARRDDGGVECWGDNSWGQLNLDPDGGGVAEDFDVHSTPQPIPLSGPAARVDVSFDHVCAILESGEVDCWGDNSANNLARDTGGPPCGPATPPQTWCPGYSAGPGPANLSHVVRTVSGVALTDDARLLSWGSGPLGRPTTAMNPSPVPAPIPTLEGVTAFDATDRGACAIAGGEVYCWGITNTQSDAFATGSAFPSFMPTLHTLDVHPQEISVGEWGICVRMTNGTVQCAGTNTEGELGLGDAGAGTSSVPRPVPASAFSGRAVQVAVSQGSPYVNPTDPTTVCALTQDGAVMCWGSNQSGALGTGTPDQAVHDTPVAISFEP